MFGLMKVSTHDRWVNNHLSSCSKNYWDLYKQHWSVVAALGDKITELEAQLMVDGPHD